MNPRGRSSFGARRTTTTSTHVSKPSTKTPSGFITYIGTVHKKPLSKEHTQLTKKANAFAKEVYANLAKTIAPHSIKTMREIVLLASEVSRKIDTHIINEMHLSPQKKRSATKCLKNAQAIAGYQKFLFDRVNVPRQLTRSLVSAGITDFRNLPKEFQISQRGQLMRMTLEEYGRQIQKDKRAFFPPLIDLFKMVSEVNTLRFRQTLSHEEFELFARVHAAVKLPSAFT